MKKNMLWLMMVLLLSVIVFADITVTYELNRNNVQVMPFICENADCSQVGAFTGTILKETAADGILKLKFENNAPEQGYALFFTSPGYFPLEIRTYLQMTGNGHSSLTKSHSTNPLYAFPERADNCKAEISQLRVLNVDKPYIPIIIDSRTSLSAATSSAFSLAHYDPRFDIEYIPPELKDNYYAADTEVDLNIIDTSDDSIIDSQIRYFDLVHGNPIMADDEVNVNFTWIPTLSGTYIANITSRVTDNQCDAATMIPQSAWEQFIVLSEEPLGVCYALISNLDIITEEIFEGTAFDISFDWLSNYVDTNGDLQAVQMDYEWQIIKETAESTQVISSGSGTLNANANPESYSTKQITISSSSVPSEEGSYIFEVNGIPKNLGACSGLEKENSVQYVDFTVKSLDSAKHDLSLRVVSNAEAIYDANVKLYDVDENLISEESTNVDGFAVFTDLIDGDYNYVVSKNNYETKQGWVEVKETQTITVNIASKNEAPVITLPNEFKKDKGDEDWRIDLDEYVEDEDLPGDLVWDFSESNLPQDVVTVIEINEKTHIAEIEINNGASAGSEVITFEVKDTEDKTSSKQVTFTLTSTNTAPTWDKIDEINFTEGQRKHNVLFLPEYAHDDLTASLDLIYTITNAVDIDARAGVSITADKYLSILPHEDFFGNFDITIEAKDAHNAATTTDVTVNIKNVNDAPIIIKGLSKIQMDEGATFEIIASEYFEDADILIDPTADSLIFSTTVMENIEITIDGVNGDTITLTPNAHMRGVRYFDLTATDEDEESVTITNIEVHVDANDVWIQQNIPDDSKQIDIEEDTIIPYQLDLTSYGRDFELGDELNNWEVGDGVLNWTAVNDYDTSLITVVIESTTDILTITPIANQCGETDLTLVVSDDDGHSDNQTILVKVACVADAPVIDDILDFEAQWNALNKISFDITDVDLPYGDTLLVDAQIDPALTGWVTTPTSTTDNGNVQTVEFEFTPTDFGTTFTVDVTVEDNGGLTDTKSFTLTVTDKILPDFSNSDPVDATDFNYDPNFNYDFNVDVEDNGQIVEVLFELKDASGIIISDYAVQTVDNWNFNVVQALDVGSYQYRWTATDDAVPANVVESNWYNFDVLKIDPSLALTLDDGNGPVSSDIQIAQNILVTIEGTLTAPAIGDLKLYVETDEIKSEIDASVISEDYTFNDQGTFNVIFEFVDTTGNYNDFSASHTVTVDDTTDPLFANEVVPLDGDYDSSADYTWSIEITDNVAVDDSTVKLVVDGTDYPATVVFVPATNIYECEVTINGLDAGSYDYQWYAEDTSGNSAIHPDPAGTLVINKLTPVMVLTLNGFDADLSVLEIDNLVDVVGTLSVPAAGNLKLFVDAVQIGTDVIGGSVVNVDDHLFAYQVDPYVVTFEFVDTTGNYDDLDVDHTVTVSRDTTLPSFDNEVVPLDGDYSLTADYVWSVEITDDVDVADLTVKLVVDDGTSVTDFVATVLGGDVYEVVINGLDAGSYDFNWYAEDTSGNPATTVVGTLIINKLTPVMVLTLNGFDADLSVLEIDNLVDVVGTLSVPAAGNLKLFVDAVQIGTDVIGGSVVNVDDHLFAYQVDPYVVTFEFVDTTGNYDDLDVDHTVTVSRDTTLPSFDNEVVPLDGDYSSTVDYVWSVEITDDVDVADLTVKLVVDDGTSVTDFVATVLGGDVYEVVINGLDAGSYDFNWYAEDTSGNPATTTVGTLVIDKADPTIVLTLNSLDVDLTVLEANNLVDIAGTLTVPAAGNLKLYVDAVQIGTDVIGGSDISVDDHLFAYQVDPYVVTFEFVDTSGNYDDLDIDHTVTVIRDTTDPLFNNEINPSATPYTYDPNRAYNWSVEITDDIEVDSSTVKLTLNDGTNSIDIDLTNGLIQNGDLYSYSQPNLNANVVDYTYNWYAEDTSGNFAETTLGTLTINRADPVAHLTLNGYEHDITVHLNDNIDISGTIDPDTLVLTLTVDGVQVDQAAGQVSDSTSFAGAGDVVVNLNSPQTTNYNEFDLTYTITVLALPVQSNYEVNTISYVADYDLDYTYFDLTFDTQLIDTTCRWSFTDQAYVDMPDANKFSDVATTSHSDQITGLTVPLEVKTVYIACVGEDATNNDEKTFDLENILNGSTLTGTNAITNSIATTDTIEDSTIADSTVTDSGITNSTINNASDVSTSTVLDSQINSSQIISCTLTNVIFRGGSTCFNSNIRNANVGCNLSGSTMDGGHIDDDSDLIDSYSLNSYIYNGSSIIGSTLLNAVINNSDVDNSKIEDAELNDALVKDGVLESGKVEWEENGVAMSYEVGVDGPAVNLVDKVNNVPVAVISVNHAAANTNQDIEFDASQSTDENNDTLTYLWDFGDGITSTDKIANHAYSDVNDTPGYPVTLTVDDGRGKSNTSDYLMVVTKKINIQTDNQNTGNRGGGGGSSRIKTVKVWKEGSEITFRMLDLLRFNINNVRYPVTLNIYRTDAGKVTFLLSGIRYDLKQGETKEFDLNRDNVADVSITGIKLTKSSVTLRFLPAGTAVSQYVAPPMPVFNIPPKDDVKSINDVIKEETAGKINGDDSAKEEVQVTAKVGSVWSKIANSFKNVFGVKEAVSSSGGMAMVVIAGVILAGLGIFFVIRKVYFV